MARYIDADKFIATLLRLNKESQSLIETMRYKAIMDLVRLEPTADVVEVVRCKDCKHCEDYDEQDEYGWYHCASNDMPTKLDHYCNFGERK